MSESTQSDFVGASKAAESWVMKVGLVAIMKDGDVDFLYHLLMDCAHDNEADNLAASYAAHSDAIEAYFDELRAITDGPISWRDLLGLKDSDPAPFGCWPLAWSSAHEAAAGIAKATLDLLVAPLYTLAELAEDPSSGYVNDDESQTALARHLLGDRRAALTFAAAPFERLKERLRRERAIFLRQRAEDKAIAPTLEPAILPLLDRLLDALTAQQGAIVKHLFEKKTASFDTLGSIPNAWRDGNPTDEAIIKALKKARQRLEERGIWDVEIEISASKRRATIKLNDKQAQRPE